MALLELIVDEWDGKTLRDLGLINIFEMQVIAKRKAHEQLRKGDIVLGDRKALAKLQA